MRLSSKISFLLFVLMICLSISLIGCESEGNDIFEYRVNANEKTCVITGLKAINNPEITIPEKIGKYTVVGIDNEAFERNNIKKIYLPNTIQSIGIGAFKDCYLLTDIIGLEECDSITAINAETFMGCWELTNIKLPPNTQIIAKSAFEQCISLQRITLSDTVTTIGESAFKECESLTSIVIPEKVKVINEYTFQLCVNLRRVTLPDGVHTINQCAFLDCESLANINMPQSLKNIKSGAFSGCSNLVSIILPEGMEVIESLAFGGCFSLYEVTLPSSLKQLGVMAFDSCVSLKNVYVNKDSSILTSVDGVVYSKDGLTIVFYPGGKTQKEFTIPNGVEQIEGMAFGDCQLQVLHIPKSVKSIGMQVFYGSPLLKTINYDGTIDEWRKIEKHDRWNDDDPQYGGRTPDFTIYCTDGTIDKDGTVKYYQ